MQPPALPIAPQAYDPNYVNQLNRILTLYLAQEASEQLTISQQQDVDTLMTWLGGM